MFLGRFEHALDAKGRLAVPAKFRGELAAGLVVTRGIDRCLSVYPLAAWRALAGRVSALSISDPDARQFKRMVFAEAVDEELDAQGRMLVPPELRRYAEIDREAIVVGVNEYVEIWNPARWEGQSAAVEDEGASIAQRLAALI
ncbi:MAG: Cell division protein MraZ [uncultured Thermomicrobiales bacterium]|uniref:Transcriptional regulator MraZ n=1 Tax=uncultured Thermomicrobiales bacterium TaxID=1645740 RepID=A0A6J4VKQ3_9BACT|nr:MAG: Cell division protein MraZ [uncultured Thermomicrobiales bacterium]